MTASTPKPRPRKQLSFSLQDEKVRGLIWQAVVVAITVAVVAWLWSNTSHNLAVRRISTGFAFLGREAGMPIVDTWLPYSPKDTYFRAFLVGIVNTLRVAVIGIVLATALGTVIGIAYIVAFNAPPLVLTGTATILVLAYWVRRLPYSVRAGAAILQQIDPAVEEASVSLGVPPLRTFWKVTARLMLPGIVSGTILTWVQTITEISATVFLYTAAWSTVTVVIYRQVSSSNFGAAAAASTLLLAAVFVPVLLANWTLGDRAVGGI